ncbi:MAG: proton-conducting transporter membrane subunit [Planctomycetia bacterium]|nr:proton-conducting transporter membrane subunit [Planctomycetia bacterium]
MSYTTRGCYRRKTNQLNRLKTLSLGGNDNSVDHWRELWNPVVLLGGAGTIGVVAAHWPKIRGLLGPWCLLALLLALLSWSDAGDVTPTRGVFAISIAWGLLLIVAQWPHRVTESDRDDSRTLMLLPLNLVLLAGLGLAALAGDVVTLFLGLQLVAFGTDVVTADSSRTRERSIRCLTTSSTSQVLASLLLFGFILLVAVTGSTRVETIAEVLHTSYLTRDAARSAITGGGSRMLTLAITFIGVALSGYAFAAPFHPGVVDTVERAPLSTASTALLLPRVAALLVWLRLWPSALTASESTAQLLVGVLAGVTFVMPLLQARLERKLVRQWTLLVVAQGGWLLLSIGAWSFEHKPVGPSEAWPVVEWNLPNADQAVWFWLLFDGVAVIGLFGVLAFLRRRERRAEFLEDLQGLLKYEPIAAVCSTICLLSLVGVPLLAGFWSRLFVAMAAMDVRGEWGPAQLLVPHVGLMTLTALAALSSVWSASIAGRSVWTMFFGLPLGQPKPTGASSTLFVAVLASLMLLGCGLLPGPLLSWLCAPLE